MDTTTETTATPKTPRNRKPSAAAASTNPACPAHEVKDDKTLLTFKRTRICEECKPRWDAAAELSDAADLKKSTRPSRRSNLTVAAPPAVEGETPAKGKTKKAKKGTAEEAPAAELAASTESTTTATAELTTAAEPKKRPGGHQVGETDVEITPDEIATALTAANRAAGNTATTVKADLTKMGADMMGVVKGAWAVRRDFAGAIAIALLSNPTAPRESVTWKDVAKVAGEVMAKACPNPYNFLIWALRLNNNETKMLVAIAPGTYALPGSKAAKEAAKHAKAATK